MYKLVLIIVLDKTLKGIYGVQLDNRKVLHKPGPTTNYFDFWAFFLYFKNLINRILEALKPTKRNNLFSTENVGWNLSVSADL